VIGLTIRSGLSDASLDVSLYLAGIRVDIPAAIIETNKQRPICMADAEDMDGRMAIVSTGRRYGRNACALMGMEPLFIKELPGNTTYRIDVFKDPRILALGKMSEEKNVSLIITYGEKIEHGSRVPSQADVVLAYCKTGYDLGSHRMFLRDSVHYLAFEHPAPRDFEVRFWDSKRNRLLGLSFLNQGKNSVSLPRDAVYSIDVKQTVTVIMVPLSLFDEPEEDMAVKFFLSR